MAIDLRLRQFGSLFSEGIEADRFVTRADIRRRRKSMLSETLAQQATRLAAVAGHALRPDKFRDLPATVDCILRESMIKPAGLPDPSRALSSPDGLCGLVAELSPEILVEAMSRGLYVRPLMAALAWWSPSLRHVIIPGQAKIPTGVRGHLRKGDLQVTFDRDFDQVLADCTAAARQRFDGSALPPRLMKLFAKMHDAGFAHSFEVRDRGRLVAGGFGFGIGGIFTTEQMFGDSPDAVDLGLTLLNRHLTRWGFAMHDVKTDASFERFGARALPRQEFLQKASVCLGGGKTGRWSVDRALCGPPMPGQSESGARH